MTRWLVSRTRGLDALDLDARPLPLDAFGNLEPLAELVALVPTRGMAGSIVAAEFDSPPAPKFWMVVGPEGAPLGWDSWTHDEDGTWTRWLLLPLEPGLDVSPVPPCADPRDVLNEQVAKREPVDPLIAMLACDPEAVRAAILARGASLFGLEAGD